VWTTRKPKAVENDSDGGGQSDSLDKSTEDIRLELSGHVGALRYVDGTIRVCAQALHRQNADLDRDIDATQFSSASLAVFASSLVLPVRPGPDLIRCGPAPSFAPGSPGGPFMDTSAHRNNDDTRLRLFALNLVWDESAQALRVTDSTVAGLVGTAVPAGGIHNLVSKSILGLVAFSAVINTPRENEHLYGRIERSPDTADGKPRIKGTCIPVEAIIQGKLEGLSSEELLDAYPQLSSADIRAALLFANDATNAYRRKNCDSRFTSESGAFA
jgi:uncharacterized protein (DUF433 family)